ncbi:MAG: PGPGW domain-containing protein [Thiolinea sp.]
MTQTIINWLSQYQTALTWLGLISLFMFIFSLLLLPWLIKKIPDNYFQRKPEKSGLSTLLSPRNLIRNIIGFCILLAGLAMFVLPGQGILTALVGIAIMKFPGKFRLERWLISRNGVLPAVNWFRRKTNSPELKV